MASRYFLVYSIFTSCTVAGQSPKYALKGLEVKLKSGITRLPDDILWKHEGNKVVEFNGNEQRVYSPYEDRITLDWHSAELDITNLRYEDSGEYVLEAYVKNVLQRSDHQLEVIDKVASPTISCEMNDGSSSDISGKLVCSAEPRQPQSLMKFEWSSHGNVQMVGPNLNISLGEKHDDEVYNCTVSNPLSSETATFTAKNCYPADNSSSVLVIVGAVLSILLLLGIGIGIFFYMRHRKGSDKTTDQEDHEDEKWPLRHSSTTYPLPQGSAPIKPDNDSDDYVGQSEDNAAAANKHLLVSDIIKQYESLESHNERLKRPQPKNRSTKKKIWLVKEADEDEEAQFPHASAETSPAAQPRSPLAKSSPNMTPKDAAGEHEAESDPDQVAGETVRESEGSTEGKQSSTVPEQKGSETSVHEQDSNLSQEETHIGESNQQEPEKTVSEDENELDCVGDEEKDMEENLRSTTYPLPQSSTPTKPDNINTFQRSPDTAHAEPDPDAEGQSRHDSGDYVGQSDEDTAAANKHLLVSDIIKQFESHNERLKRPQPKNRFTKKTFDEDEEAQSPLASAETSPAAQPRSCLTKSSLNEHKEGSDSDQDTEEAVRESEDSTKEKQSSTVPEQKGSETSLQEQDSNSDETEGQLESSTPEADNGQGETVENEVQCGPKEELDNKSLTDEGQKKGEDVE